jgi:hypothetical protein
MDLPPNNHLPPAEPGPENMSLSKGLKNKTQTLYGRLPGESRGPGFGIFSGLDLLGRSTPALK